jgi:hypothetical protein
MDTTLASKRVRAFRSRHRIQPIEVDGQTQCEYDGFRVHPVKGGFRHDLAQVERLVEKIGAVQ